ncbi:sce7725 family protein [Paenibacillus sp. FSL K6-2524]|uniref:sce7725 family protein n=1 Tax=Paenibacillus sp. FSL K6-2524 TaxID=2954516 RepID=UPI0030F6EDAD
MYYPIIRGRQYDLLAIRELAVNYRLSRHITPIIEPIKLNSTLISTLSEIRNAQNSAIVISNPKVGSFMGELEIEDIKHKFIELTKENNVTIAHHFNKNSVEQIRDIIESYEVELNDIVVVHSEKKLVNLYNDIFEEEIPKLNLIPLDNAFRRQLNGKNLVGLDDKFNKLLRNVDYLDNENEFFSEEHLFFAEEGYIGFSDYSVVGAEFNEGGFAPYAVAIHIAYPNEESALEIMHFVSDSNRDTSDPAGKFSEALDKLIEWYVDYSDNDFMNTLAMQIFKRHHNEGTYPGLPTLKKLSIMHHLELVGNILEGRLR